MRSCIRWSVAVSAATLIVISMAISWGTVGGQEAASWTAGVIGALAVAVGVLGWARRAGSDEREAFPDPGQIALALRKLAADVTAQWREEATVRQLHDPAPLAVRWRMTGLPVMDHAPHVGSGPWPGVGARADAVKDLVDQLDRLRRKRLAIIGEAGMGKTTLAILIMLELLDRADDGEARRSVPVLLTLASWDPVAETFRDWLVRSLEENYPALLARRYGSGVCRALVEERRILPVLDGLDELPASVRPQVIAALNMRATAGDELILTCRTAEYMDAVAAAHADVLTAAAVIEPSPLSADDVAAYLSACLKPHPPGHWTAFLKGIAERPDGPVARALTNPLYLSLFRLVYVDTGADPTSLTDGKSFPTLRAVRAHLLDDLIDALIRTRPPVDRRHPEHRSRPRRAWDSRMATAWLTHLAAHLQERRTSDLAWWRLHKAVSVRLLRWSSALAAVVASFSVHFPLFIVLIGTLPGQVDAIPAAAGCAGVLSALLGLGLAAANPYSSEPSSADLRLRGRLVPLLRHLRPGLALAVAAAAAAATVTPGFGVLAGSLVFLVSTALFAVDGWTATPVASDHAQSPMTTLRGDRRLTFLRVALLSAAFAAAAVLPLYLAGYIARLHGQMFVDGPAALPWTGFLSLAMSRFGLALFAILALAGAAVGLLVTRTLQEWPAYTIARIVLAARTRAPWRLMSFLEDAYRLGVLRRVGQVYQFRHAALQDRLARSVPASEAPADGDVEGMLPETIRAGFGRKALAALDPGARSRVASAWDELSGPRPQARHRALTWLEEFGRDRPDRRQVSVDAVSAYLRRPLLGGPGSLAAEDFRRTHAHAQAVLLRLARLEAGDQARLRVDLSNAHLFDFDLSEVEFETASFGYCRFHGRTDFTSFRCFTTSFFGAGFAGDAVFAGARLVGEADFSGVTFRGVADFTDALLANIAFSNGTFEGDCVFHGTTFLDGDRHDFYRAEVRGDLDLRMARTLAGVPLQQARVHGRMVMRTEQP